MGLNFKKSFLRGIWSIFGKYFLKLTESDNFLLHTKKRLSLAIHGIVIFLNLQTVKLSTKNIIFLELRNVLKCLKFIFENLYSKLDLIPDEIGEKLCTLIYISLDKITLPN